MARKKKQHHEEEGGEAWLLPYSDLMTLLLAVFIVLFAVSKLDQTKAEHLASAFRSGMMSGTGGVLEGSGDQILQTNPEGTVVELPENPGGTDATTNISTETETQTEQSTEAATETSANPTTQKEIEQYLGKKEYNAMSDVKSEVDQILKDQNLTTEVTTGVDARGLVISLNSALLFDSGSADIKMENESVLQKVAQVINSQDRYIRVEGHTDNIPINTSAYPSNWELSSARASSVVRLFVNNCGVAPDKLAAVGYGEYKPIADNSTPEGRAKNRRIDIILLSQKYNNLETTDTVSQ